MKKVDRESGVERHGDYVNMMVSPLTDSFFKKEISVKMPAGFSNSVKAPKMVDIITSKSLGRKR